MRRIWPAVVPALLVLTSCTQPDAGSGADASPGSAPSSSAHLPDPGPPRALKVGAADVGLTQRQAITVTDLAAHAFVAGAAPRDFTIQAPLKGIGAAHALLGYDGPALSCVFGRALLRDQRLGPSGLTPRAVRRPRRGPARVGADPVAGRPR